MEPSAKPMHDYLSEIARLFPHITQNESPPKNSTMTSTQVFNLQPRPILAKSHHELCVSTHLTTETVKFVAPHDTDQNLSVKNDTTNIKFTGNIGRKIVGAKEYHTNVNEITASHANTPLIPIYHTQNEYINRLTSLSDYDGQNLFQDFNDYSFYQQSMFPASNRGNDSGFSTMNHPLSSPKEFCSFCRKNGETPLVYTTHSVRTKLDGKIIVTCPILRSLVCSMCGASGDNAHTLTYCPLLRSANHGMPIQSTTIALKNTRVKSNGRRRY